MLRNECSLMWTNTLWFTWKNANKAYYNVLYYNTFIKVKNAFMVLLFVWESKVFSEARRSDVTSLVKAESKWSRFCFFLPSSRSWTSLCLLVDEHSDESNIEPAVVSFTAFSHIPDWFTSLINHRSSPYFHTNTRGPLAYNYLLL